MSGDALLSIARAAIDGTEPEGVTVFRGKETADVLAEAARPLRTILAAVLLWSLVFLRARMGAPLLDPLALVLRVVALGATLRVFLALRALARTLPELLAAKKNALVIAPAGLVIRARGRDVAIPRARLRGVMEGDRATPPTLFLAPERGEAILRLPRGLEDPRGRIAEAIDALLSEDGDAVEPTDPPLPPVERVAQDVYDRAAAGNVPPGTAVVRRGRGWLAHGPYGALLVAIALAERLIRLPEGASLGAAAYGALALALVLPLLWLVPQLRRARAARGVAAVLTPEELLVRQPAGIARMPWRKVSEIAVTGRRSWTTLGGYERLGTVVVRRDHGGDLALSEEVLGVSAGELAALAELYRHGRMRE